MNGEHFVGGLFDLVIAVTNKRLTPKIQTLRPLRLTKQLNLIMFV